VPRWSRLEMGEAEWLGQGEPDTKLCHASAQSPRQLERLCFSFSFFSISSSLAVSIACLHSSSFSVLSGSSISFPMPPSLYSPLFYSILSSSCLPSPSHLSTNITLFTSSSLPRSLSFYLLSFLAKPSYSFSPIPCSVSFTSS